MVSLAVPCLERLYVLLTVPHILQQQRIYFTVHTFTTATCTCIVYNLRIEIVLFEIHVLRESHFMTCVLRFQAPTRRQEVSSAAYVR